MDLTAARADIKTALEVIPDLTVLSRWPGRVSAPAAFFGPPDDIGYRAVYGAAMTRVTLSVRVIAAPASADTGLELLEPYMNDSGERSVPAAVDAFDASATAYSAATVTRVTETGVYTIGGADYIGATFEIDIVGSKG